MSDLGSRLAQLTPEQRRVLAAKMVARKGTSTNETAINAHSLPDNAIAIIGMSCRFPGAANSPEEFWRLLDDGVDAIEAVPPERWDAKMLYDDDPDARGKSLVGSAGFITNVADFDADFFGIAPVEARQMDPQQRLFLEVAMEALGSAGLTRTQLAGSACGVYVGVHSHSIDYYQMQSAHLESVDTYSSTGTAHSVIANRLSYFLDLRGPSMSIDTACSSSLVALHQACLSLRAGETDLAVAGGLNLMLVPGFSVSITKLRVLSPSGRCRTFDAAADGIARGEGVGAVVLKRVADAIRDGDPILAIVRGSAVNQDGATNGITAPSTPSQVAVMRTALSVARLDASRVNFVETHGTGTPLGDPIEVEAIDAVYGASRIEGDPVVLGALKTNIGHLEGAAGIASVIKTVLSLQHQRIPKNLHFRKLNPLLRLDSRSIVLPLESRSWTAASGTRVGAVSSFGFGGTNAHVILEEAPPRADMAPISVKVDGSTPEIYPLVLSAHTAGALLALVDRWRADLRATLHEVPIRDLAYTAAARRSALAHRVVVIGADTTAWAERLDAWARARTHDTLPVLSAGGRRKIAFAFAGQGSQWHAMGCELLTREPTFRAAVERVAKAVSAHVSWNLLDEMSRDETTSRIHETEITQPAMFAIQMGLVALWKSWGVEPDFVIAHSSGEIAAACAAGAMDVEEGARIAVFRGRAVSQSEGQGAMVSFPISAAEASAAIAGIEDRVAIAAVNGPASVVLGGDAASLQTIEERFKLRGI
ncbi:MAG: type I polyketide synthase, partial [Gemmatimonadaceae bacterium]